MAVLGGLVLVSSMVGLWAMGVFASPNRTVPASDFRPKAVKKPTPSPMGPSPSKAALNPAPAPAVESPGDDTSEGADESGKSQQAIGGDAEEPKSSGSEPEPAEKNEGDAASSSEPEA